MRAVAIDIETSGMTFDAQVLTIGVAWSDGPDAPITTQSRVLSHGDLFTPLSTIPETRAWLLRIIADARWLIFHNACFDLPYLLRLGLLTSDELKGRVFDTLVMAATSGAHASLALTALCPEFGVPVPASWARMKGMRGKLASSSMSEVADYCEEDCGATLAVYYKLLPEVAGIYDDAWIAREGDYCALLARMRVRGIQLDLAFVQAKQTECRTRVALLLQEILIPAGIPSANTHDKVWAWVKRADLTPNWTSSTSLDAETLQAIRAKAVRDAQPSHTIAVLDAVLECRKLSKIDSTYLTGYLAHADPVGVIHANFFNGGTRTWRLSSNQPDTQNVPRDLQGELFTASQPGGALLALDYSQAQLRLAAMYAKEHEMARLFALTGTDIHTATAIALFGAEEGPRRRREGKGANFAVLFGSGAAGVASNYHLDIEIANQVLAEHRQAFPRLQAGSREASRRWATRGYLILPYGKRTYARYDDLAHRSFVAWNYLIQGAEGTIMEHAMLELERQGFPPLVNQVHDSLYFDVPPDLDPDQVGRDAAAVLAAAVPADLCSRTDPPITMPTETKIKRRPG